MLRSALLGLRQPFTCVVSLVRQHPVDCGHVRAGLHSSSAWSVLPKDHPYKKSSKTRPSDSYDSNEVKGDNPTDITPELEEFRPEELFPTMKTAETIIDGVRFDELPIVHIKATHNNTILTATDGRGKAVALESGGTVGFKNAKKGTNIAAQAAAVTLGEKSLAKGLRAVRVSVKGIGPGRMAAIKGLQMAGLTVISITDATPLPFNGNRPRKPRRL